MRQGKQRTAASVSLSRGCEIAANVETFNTGTANEVSWRHCNKDGTHWVDHLANGASNEFFSANKTASICSFLRLGSVGGREPQLGVPADALLRQDGRGHRRLHLQDAPGQEELRQRRRHW